MAGVLFADDKITVIGDNIPRSEMAKKSLRQKEQDLSNAIGFLKDYLKKIDEEDWKYVNAISGQLRALIGTGSRSLNPLLINLAEEKSVDLECYAFSYQRELEQMPDLTNSMVLGFTPTPVVVLKPVNRPTFRKKKFNKWIEEPILKLGDHLYTGNEIIRMVAEKEGGAHYDDALPEKLIKAKEKVYHKSGTEFNHVQAIIVSIAMYVVEVSEIVLNKDI